MSYTATVTFSVRWYYCKLLFTQTGYVEWISLLIMWFIKKQQYLYIILLYIYIIYFLNVSYEHLINNVFYLKYVTNLFVKTFI